MAITIWIRANCRFVIGAMPEYNNRQVFRDGQRERSAAKLSWFLDVSQRNFNTAQLINAETLGPAPAYVITTYNSTYATPSKNYQINPRLDIAINS